MQFDDRGREILDPTPVAIPVGFKRPPSLQEMIKQYVRRELSQVAHQAGEETFEEADDFDVGDDYDPRSPWELDFDQETASTDPAAAAAAPSAGAPAAGAAAGQASAQPGNSQSPPVEDGADAGTA